MYDLNVVSVTGNVSGVDRTFNLGLCYVTLLTFKNGDLRRRTTWEPPIFMGPA